jgi:hypothetical protein
VNHREWLADTNLTERYWLSESSELPACSATGAKVI